MEYKIIDKKSYNIHTLKTNRYKTSMIEVFFRVKATKENIHLYNFLSDLLDYSCKDCPTHRDMVLKSKELYNTFFHFRTIVMGETIAIYASTNFINPKYIDENNYLDNVIKSFFSFIQNPNVKNNEFDNTTFNVVKNNILLDIDSINENPERKALRNAFNLMDKDSISSVSILGSKEQIEKITPSNIYNLYVDMIENANVDIFVSGNIDMENICFLIDKYYVNNRIRNNEFNYFVENKNTNKIKKKIEIDNFDQTQLVCLYNVNGLTKYERDIVFWVYNYILGNGGLNCKLYKYVREENSLCYRISSLFIKFSSLLCITSSLAKENVDTSITLIEKAINEMKKGLFTDDDLIDAKINMKMALDIQRKSPEVILDNLEMKYFSGTYDIEEKISMLEKVTKEDIIRLANKVKANTYYELKEAEHE